MNTNPYSAFHATSITICHASDFGFLIFLNNYGYPEEKKMTCDRTWMQYAMCFLILFI